MPVGINSPARLFLLGSSGSQVVTNFFKKIDESASSNYVHEPVSIRYNGDDETYVLSGHADRNSPSSNRYGWIERRQEDGTQDWSEELVSTTSSGVYLEAIETNFAADEMVAVGRADDVPFIAKYGNNGDFKWQSTSQFGDVTYNGVAIQNGNYYACGNTEFLGGQSNGEAFVEKYDSNGNPGWNKSAIMFGRDVVLNDIAANSRDEVVAVGFLEDDSANKGYIVKLSSFNGEVQWDRTLELSPINSPTSGDYIDVSITAITIDDDDSIYVVGNIDPAPPFGAGTTPHEAFIAKYSPEGNLLWQSMTDKDAGTMNGVYYNDITVDNVTKKATVIGRTNDNNVSGQDSVLLTRYNANGSLSWRRELRENAVNFRAKNASGDGDQSFVYLVFNDDSDSESYVYGKVSATGNGLGDFEYDDGTGTPLLDYITTSGPNGSGIGEKIGRLSDGSIRNDSSDLITYPFTANKILFDDFATPITNKRRQMDSANSFFYNIDPLSTVSNFSEVNLLHDTGFVDEIVNETTVATVKDQSGKGNDGVASFTTTTTLPGTTESENFASTTSSYSTFGTVAENTVTNDLPFTATHYSGTVRDLQTGGFRLDLTGNTTGTDFFMGCWIKFDTYTNSRQMGVDLFGDYVYWETLSNGAIAVRHVGGSRADSSATSLNDGNWHHIALSRTGGTLYGFLDGTAVISTTNGVSGNSVNTNENFWFFGGSGTAYNTDAKVLDPFVYVGAGTSSYTVPTAPLIDSDGNINHFSGFSGNEEYISPAIALSGATTSTTTGPTLNDDGYWEFNGTPGAGEGDKIIIGEVDNTSNYNWIHDRSVSEWAIEGWYWNNIDEEYGAMISNNSGTSSVGFYMGQRNDEQFECVINKGTFGTQACRVLSTDLLDHNRWYHIVFVNENYTIKLYIDGVLQSNGGDQNSFSAGSTADAQTDLRIGKLATSPTWNLNGRIGEVRIYKDKTLSEAEVYQNYDASRYKYDGIAQNTFPLMGDDIYYDDDLSLNFDFGNDFVIERLGTIQG